LRELQEKGKKRAWAGQVNIEQGKRKEKKRGVQNPYQRKTKEGFSLREGEQEGNVHSIRIGNRSKDRQLTPPSYREKTTMIRNIEEGKERQAGPVNLIGNRILCPFRTLRLGT